MSEVPQARAIKSDEAKRIQSLQLGVVLLAAAAVLFAIYFGYLPNFLKVPYIPFELPVGVAIAPVPTEIVRYFAEPVGIYALVFLLVGITGAPASPRDYYGGALLVAIAVFALEASRDLPGMRGFAFGPGTAPRGFAFVLGGLGLAVTAMGFLTKGAGIDRFHLRGPVFVTISVVVFAWTVRPLGLIFASFISICAAAGATPEAKVLETIIWGAALTAFCCFLFPYALNLPMQLGPITCDPTVLFKGQQFTCDPAALFKALSSIR